MTTIGATTAAAAAAPPPGSSDVEYAAFLASVAARCAGMFAAHVPAKRGVAEVFHTDATGLYDAYLAALPAEARPSETCATCRAFVDRFGDLVVVDDRGGQHALLWDPATAPPFYGAVVKELAARVGAAAIVAPLRSAAPTWGHALKGSWPHLSITPPAAAIFQPKALETETSVVGRLVGEREMLVRALAEYPPPLVTKAVALLRTDALYRSEACLGVAEWLAALHARCAAASSAKARERIVWLAAATAPPGFCHVKGGMIGTLLDDFAGELPYAAIAARFAAKMHPLAYQRPTAAPSAQNVERAEKRIAEMRAAGSLARRFAKLADLQTTWRPPSPPAPPAVPKGGVFGHLTVKGKRAAEVVDVDAPATTMTWEKLARTILPTATKIELHIPAGSRSYGALVTAADPDAPPILQWDVPEHRNPVSLYTYVDGTTPDRWGLVAGTQHEVSAIALSPPMWRTGQPSGNHGSTVVFALTGATDVTYKKGAGFFPSYLKSELHEIRATLEAYTTAAVVAGKDEAEACGLLLTKGNASTWNARLSVTATDGTRRVIVLDRWD